MNSILLRSPRLRAFAIHLAISAAVGSLSALFVSQVWYPSPMLAIMGGFGIFLIIIGIDVILGPTITLIIASPGKSRRALMIDYTVIACLQIAALAYGLNTLGQARPAFVVFAKDGFLIIRVNDLYPEDLRAATLPQYRSVGMLGPVWADSELPKDTSERNQIILQAASGGRDYWSYPKYFKPLDNAVLSRAAKPIDELRKKLPAGVPLNVSWTSGMQASDVSKLGYLPFIGKTQTIAAVVDRPTGQVVGYAWHSPW